jgi:hypothetical protein
MALQIILLKDLKVTHEVQEFIMAQVALMMDPEVPESNVKNLAAWRETIYLGMCYGYQLAVSDLSSGSFKPDDPDGG